MSETVGEAKAPADWMSDARLQAVFETIIAAGGQVRVAGGAVRNWLLGEAVNDIDLATTLLPRQVMDVCEDAGFSCHPTGIDHGTVTVVNDALVLEITTLRADVETDGRRAVVAFSDDWRQDAERRDFTINALYADLSGNVFDFTRQGLADIKTRRIRFVGDAHLRIREDYLRILRFFRFEARYGAGRPADAQALRACVDLREGLKQISAERIQSELLKILMADGVRRAVEQMCEAKILPVLIETDCDLGLLDGLLAGEELLGLERDAILRLGCLTCSPRNLRLPRRDENRLEQVCAGTALTPQTSLKKRKERLYRDGKQKYCDDVAMSFARTGALCDAGEVQKWRDVLALVEDWPIPVFPLSGKDLLDAGFKAGKALGAMLAELERQWIESGFQLEKSELLNLADKLRK